MPPQLTDHLFDDISLDTVRGTRQETPTSTGVIRAAMLGCGMMSCEHISYMAGYPEIRVDFLCDPHEPSLRKALKVLHDFAFDNTNTTNSNHHPEGASLVEPTLVHDEMELLERYVHEIDLLVVASPNHLHTDTLLRWGRFEHLTILVEKPVAVSFEQHARLTQAASGFRARIWVAMEYRFIPAMTKLLQLIPETVGDIKMVTIRENRYPFLHKIGAWNRDRHNTGDSLVEKCCHFFDLMRLITGQEVNLPQIRALAQRGINYTDEPAPPDDTPIIDSAYVTLPFQSPEQVKAIGCLELCMFAEGSRHQEEIIVTGTKGRLEAYLPENKVYAYTRPSHQLWSNRAEPPTSGSIQHKVYDCSNVRLVHGLMADEDEDTDTLSSPTIPTHGGYHYSSTAIEWYKLLQAMKDYRETGIWTPLVSLQDGLRAVEIGLHATLAIVNEPRQEQS